MRSLFNKVQMWKPRSSNFDLSHERKQSMELGKLYPMLCQEVLPGDRFKVRSEILLRFSPLVAPVMHRMNVFTHYFFVPNRLVFEEWEDFITGGQDGTDSTAFPTLAYNDANKAYFVKGRLGDYLGIPVNDGVTTITNGTTIGALPFRAYQMIFNEYYRDQTLRNEISFGVSTSTSGDETALTTLRRRAWEKDYFTSALPWAQRGGDVAVEVEGSFIPDYMDTSRVQTYLGVNPTAGNLSATAGGNLQDAAPVNSRIENLTNPQEITDAEIDINSLRDALTLQRWLEKNARGGYRYIEQILSHFGVISDDARLQRPEYLGGGRQPVVISEVLQTSESSGTAQGTMSGHGISVGSTNRFNKRFKEHGYVMGIMSVIPRTCYSQGIPRTYRKSDKTDFAFPEFAHLGEQEIENQEIYFDGLTSGLQDAFGYQSRYAEYKYQPDSVHGDFRDTLNHWHVGREFGSAPSLNSTFVECDPRTDIFAVGSDDVLWSQIYNEVRANRPLPYFGTPRL